VYKDFKGQKNLIAQTNMKKITVEKDVVYHLMNAAVSTQGRFPVVATDY